MNKLVLLVLALAFSLSATAQKRVTTTDQVNHNLEGNTAPKNSGFGLKGGYNYFNVYGNPGTYYNNPEAIPGFHAGAFAQFGITRNFSVQTEVLFSRKGFKAGNSGIAGGTDNIGLDYFDVPLLFSFRILNNFSLMAGPQASLLITVKEGDREVDKAGYNSLDYGGAAGIEGRFSAFRIGARYNRSYESIYNEEMTISPGNNFKHSGFQVYLGAGF